MEEQLKKTDLLKRKIKNSVTLKAAIITIVALMLLIPTSFVEDIIRERESYKNEAIYEVSSKWGGSQTIAGPILSVPYQVVEKTLNDQLETYTYYAHFTPKELRTDGDISTETRHRGIYDIVLYNAGLSISGTFDRPDFTAFNIRPDSILWDEAILSIGIPDLTGISQEVNLKWNNQTAGFKSGIPTEDVFYSGIFAPAPLNDQDKYSFHFNLDLRGSNRLAFVPVGQYTEVNVRSPWKDPSFDGDFLPHERTVTDEGFNSQWKVFDLNRNIPNQWTGSREGLFEHTFGVRLLIPVDEYQKNLRSTKYALLIIALTFLTFFLSEIIIKKQIHPFQYIFAGLALVVFYIMMVSMSEHFGFDIAYIVSAILTGVLIVVYISAAFRNNKFTLALSAFFTIVYSFIYVILQLQDFSLLVGSLGLFIALATTMYLTRNIDWYNVGKRPSVDLS
ncbi:MAG: cell envelope integrity protein CreD [Cyclobacteriaceae bacterium]|nr:cell envelope integrity protein CreD [Cyclobacteriaceae bacterium]